MKKNKVEMRNYLFTGSKQKRKDGNKLKGHRSIDTDPVCYLASLNQLYLVSS